MSDWPTQLTAVSRSAMEWTRLGKLVEAKGVQTGPFGSQLHASDYTSSGVGVVMPQDLGENEIVGAAMARISRERASVLSRHTLLPGDIVYSRRGDVTRRAFVRASDGELICGTGCLRVRVNSSIADARFVSYAVGTPDAKAWISRHAVGATMANLNTAILSELPLRLPSLSQQRAIAEVLGALDDKIAVNRRVAEHVDRLSELLFAAQFSDAPIDSLASVADVNRVTIVPRAGGELRYLDIAAVSEGTFRVPPVSSWAEAPGRARRGVRPGDTLWSTVRPNRRSHCLVLEDDPLLVASTGLAVLSPRECGPAFLYEASRRPKFQEFLESVAEGSAYPAVRSSEFRNAPVPRASSTELTQFEERVAPLRHLQALRRFESDRLATTRDELLPLLMSGRITMKDAEQRLEGEL